MNPLADLAQRAKARASIYKAISQFTPEVAQNLIMGVALEISQWKDPVREPILSSEQGIDISPPIVNAPPIPLLSVNEPEPVPFVRPSMKQARVPSLPTKSKKVSKSSLIMDKIRREQPVLESDLFLLFPALTSDDKRKLQSLLSALRTSGKISRDPMMMYRIQ